MKFLTIGCKPDVFRSSGNVTTVASELPSDVCVVVEGRVFHLHKFPLMTKCGLLRTSVARNETSKEIILDNIPGGSAAFELCAKFCYGIVITLHAFNVMAVRCASEHLKMTDTFEKGNLQYKTNAFLNSIVFQSWKDCIISLQSTKALHPWAEDFGLVSRCIEAVALKASTGSSQSESSFPFAADQTSSSPPNKHPRCSLGSPPSDLDGLQEIGQDENLSSDWWIEDVCELDIDLYKRLMVAIKSSGKISAILIGKSLQAYSYKWIPGLSRDQHSTEAVQAAASSFSDDYVDTADRCRIVLETIVNLLPDEKRSLSCGFLLKLLKAANILMATSDSKTELARRIGMQLEDATVDELLIPSLSYASDSLYDVDLVHQILEYNMMHDPHCLAVADFCSNELSNENQKGQYGERFEPSLNRQSSMCVVHGSKSKVAKLIDEYLAEVARDANLALDKFISIAELIPVSARPLHDNLYRAIDIYLKEHPGITKTERKRLCRLMDCKKLSMDACVHAAQNDRLPLRVVVKVLFFEQLRSAMMGGYMINDLPSNVLALMSPETCYRERVESGFSAEEDWEAFQKDYFAASNGDLNMNMAAEVHVTSSKSMRMQTETKATPKSRSRFFLPRRFFRKIWPSTNQCTAKTPTSTSRTHLSAESFGSSEASHTTTESKMGRL